MKRTLKELLYLQIVATVNFIIIIAFAKLYDEKIQWWAYFLFSGVYVGGYYFLFYFLKPMADKYLN